MTASQAGGLTKPYKGMIASAFTIYKIIRLLKKLVLAMTDITKKWTGQRQD